MANKKKILIQLSEEDTEFFSKLLARDDVEIVSDVRWNEIETTKATYTFTTIENHIHIKQLNDELVEHQHSFMKCRKIRNQNLKTGCLIPNTGECENKLEAANIIATIKN